MGFVAVISFYGYSLIDMNKYQTSFQTCRVEAYQIQKDGVIKGNAMITICKDRSDSSKEFSPEYVVPKQEVSFDMVP